MKFKIVLGATAVVFLAVTLIFAGCAPAPEPVDPVVDEEEVFTVGLSNGLITHSWRTQMTAALVQEVGFYQGMGWVDELFVQHAGFDVDVQISQIRLLIDSGVDLLLINPNSQGALNPVIEEANDRGILVFVFDQDVTSDIAYQIVPDQISWMTQLAEYVVDRIDGEGDVVYMSGFDGSPANTERDIAVDQVLENNPNVNLLTKVNGDWDPATAQTAMATVLAAFPQIDAVMTQDGMALGVVRAFQAANRPTPIMNGEGMIPFMEEWMELRDTEGFESFAIANGPGFTINYALGVGLRMLRGEEIDEAFWNAGPREARVELGPQFDNDTLDEVYDAHIALRGITDYIDDWPSQADLDALFE